MVRKSAALTLKTLLECRSELVMQFPEEHFGILLTRLEEVNSNVKLAMFDAL